MGVLRDWILESILLSIFGRTEQNRPSAGHSWMWRGWGWCTFWMPGCLSEALKRLEKWAGCLSEALKRPEKWAAENQ